MVHPTRILMSKHNKPFGTSKTSNGCVADVSVPIFPSDMTHYVKATDPNIPPDSTSSIWESIPT